MDSLNMYHRHAMECPICFDAIVVSKTGITTMSCGHSFHFYCLSKWFLAQPTCECTCPCCRHVANETETLVADGDEDTILQQIWDSHMNSSQFVLNDSIAPSASTIALISGVGGIGRTPVIETIHQLLANENGSDQSNTDSSRSHNGASTSSLGTRDA